MQLLIIKYDHMRNLQYRILKAVLHTCIIERRKICIKSDTRPLLDDLTLQIREMNRFVTLSRLSHVRSALLFPKLNKNINRRTYCISALCPLTRFSVILAQQIKSSLSRAFVAYWPFVRRDLFVSLSMAFLNWILRLRLCDFDLRFVNDSLTFYLIFFESLSVCRSQERQERNLNEVICVNGISDAVNHLWNLVIEKIEELPPTCVLTRTLNND